MKKLSEHIEAEIAAAERAARSGDRADAFHHLEQAHVLGQASTYYHTRVHWLMLKHGLRYRDGKEIAGQVLRIGGAATKTPFGIYPQGNTGGANVSPFRPMPIESGLAEILAKAEK